MDELDNVFVSPASERTRQSGLVWSRPALTEPRLPDGKDIAKLPPVRHLGAGGFGSVYLSFVGQVPVAVKKMHSCTRNEKARIQSFRAELNVLHFRHPNIVRTLASSSENDIHGDAYILMEFAGETNLQQLLNESTEALDRPRRISYCLDIISALEYIHGNGIAHLDVKPANMLVGAGDVLKLADFGCCQSLDVGAETRSPTRRCELTGTLFYRAPELLRGHLPTAKADIYSLGITMWAMLTRETPYQGEGDQHAIIFQVVSRGRRPRLPVSEDQEEPRDVAYIDLFVQCWAQEVGERPEALQLLQIVKVWHEQDQDDT